MMRTFEALSYCGKYYHVYKLLKIIDEDTATYQRYDDEGIFIYTTKESAAKKADELNEKEDECIDQERYG